MDKLCKNCCHWWGCKWKDATFDYCEIGLQSGDDRPNATTADYSCDQFTTETVEGDR